MELEKSHCGDKSRIVTRHPRTHFTPLAMSQTLENTNANPAIVAPVDKDMPMVVNDLDDKIVQIKCEAEKAQELAKAWIDQLKADKVEHEHKRLEDEKRCKDEELRKVEELQKAEEDCLEKEEAAAKMHADKAEEQWDVSRILCFPCVMS